MSPDIVALQAGDENSGAKALTLARLAAKGLPVLPGFVVPAVTPCDRLDAVAAELSVWAGEIAPHGIIARSSAPGEDEAAASFAGLFRSCFAGTHRDEIYAAITGVRASLTAPDVPSYAALRRVPVPAQMAVLIQPAIRPYASGVAAIELTAGAGMRSRIEAVQGLAEPLVGGDRIGEIHYSDPGQHTIDQVTDQRLILLPGTALELRTPPGEILALPHPRLGATPAKVAYSSGNLVQFHRPSAWADHPVLDDGQHRQVLSLARATARVLHLDLADIEWALLPGNQVVLLQARPLTAPIHSAQARPEADCGWRGLPAAPGVGEGPATHLGQPNARGSVLICQALTAETVATLLDRPAAIVASRGGTMSHTAILARELGIPCVVNVAGAGAIKPGQILHVDGTTGTIRSIRTRTASHFPVESASPRTTIECVLGEAPPAARRSRSALIADPDHPASASEILTALHANVSGSCDGLLIADPRSTLPQLPPGWRVTHPDRLVRLIWPDDGRDLPEILRTPLSAHDTSLRRPRRSAAITPGDFLPEDLASVTAKTLGKYT